MGYRRLISFLLLISLITLASCTEKKVADLFEASNNLLASGRYEEAISTYSRIVSEYPSTPYAPKSLYKIGVIKNIFLNQYVEAIDTFKRLLFLYPESDEAIKAQKDIADIYMERLKNYEMAVLEYQRLIKRYKELGINKDKIPDIRYRIGTAYMKMGDLEQARIEFEGILTDHPTTPMAPDIFIAIGDTYFLEGRLDDAIKTYQKVVDDHKEGSYNIEARFKIAVSLEEKGELRAALKRYKELIGIYPNQDVLKLKIKGIRERIRKPRRLRSIL